jgi:type VI secretion system secreted protein Hcp
MAVDVFLKFSGAGYEGESHDSKHKNEIDVLAWSWGVAQTGTHSFGGGGGAGKANFQDLNFTHQLDKASTKLMNACATGEHIKDATLTLRKAGKEQQEFLIVKMTDIIVTSVQPSMGGEVPTESVSLNYAKIEFDYKPQKADGSLDAAKHFGYNLKENKAF